MIDTKKKILDAAERLFAAQGYGAVSLRQIMADAGVNLASIHYHYGSKEAVLDEVIMRKAGPVNEERLARLDGLEGGTAGRLDVEGVLKAFLDPMAEAAAQAPDFCRMMGRLQAEGILTDVLIRNFQPVLTRFVGALRRALPDASEEDFRWRIHFMQGAIAHTMCSDPGPFAGADDSGGIPARVERLIPFLSGGLSAAQPEAAGRAGERTRKTK